MDIANKQMLIICESFADMFRKLADSYKDPEQPKPAEAPKAEEKKPEAPTDFDPAAPIVNKASLQEAECKIDRDLAFFRFVKEMAPRTKEPYHWFARKDSMTVGNIGHNCDFKAKSDSFYLRNILAEKFLANVFGMHDANNPKRKEMIHAIVVAMGEAERLAGINKEKEGK